MRSTASQDIQTASGWLYLAAVMDLYSRKIVGYSLSNRMTVDLVCTALQIAIYTRQPPIGLIMHTDRGSQYLFTAISRFAHPAWHCVQYEPQGVLRSSAPHTIMR